MRRPPTIVKTTIVKDLFEQPVPLIIMFMLSVWKVCDIIWWLIQHVRIVL
jgi:hypothetical protein